MHKTWGTLLAIALIFSTMTVYARDTVVRKVISGDLVQLETGEMVKYIGVDTPELNLKEGGSEFFARQAARYNQKLVMLKKVRLEFDRAKKDDKGNILAYVYVKNVFVNAELVKLGYAKARVTPPNDKYKSLFLDAERQARQNERGLWQEAKKDTEKFYIGNKRSYAFHRPSCSDVDKIPEKSKIIFRNRADAIKIGYIPDKMCKP